MEYSDAVIVFSWLLSIAAFIPAHWHIWRTNPCLCRSLQCTALQSEPSPPDQSPPWERKRELKEPGVVAGRDRQREWDRESERVLETGTNANIHISWHVTIILSEASSSFKRIVHLKKGKFCHRLLVSNLYDFFTSVENKSIFSIPQKYTVTKACQAPARTKKPHKSLIKVVYMTHTLYSKASEAIQ